MKYIFLYISILFPIVVFSQSYNSPESVDYDINTNTYFISNSGNGQILSLDANQNLTVFVSNINSGGPHGLEVVGNKLYACSGSRLLGFDINTGLYLTLVMFLSVWLCDTTAYILGSKFGKRKLCPSISP